jgi:G3E family GTPase
MVGSLAHRPVELDTVNYLIVETSGVSDPQRVIQTMDKTFGKMYRARLDSVVTVVDVDAMLGSEGRDRESGGTGAPVLSGAAGDISRFPFLHMHMPLSIVARTTRSNIHVALFMNFVHR